MRRLVTLAIFVAILAVLWTGGWFAAAQWAEARIPAALERVAKRGVAVTCADRAITGFPFAIRLHCGPTSVSEARSGATASFGGLSGGVSVFAPRTAAVELISPAEVNIPLLPTPATATWSAASVDAPMSLGGPRSVGWSARDLAAAVPVARAPDAKVTAGSIDGGMTPAGDSATKVDVRFAELALSARGIALPAFDGLASADLPVPFRALLAGRAELKPPLTLSNIDAALSHGDARVETVGDLSVDAEGIVDGVVTLRVAGANDLAEFVAALPPDRQRYGNAAVGGLLAFGQPASVDGRDGSELRVEIVRGRVRIGPVEVDLPRFPP